MNILVRKLVREYVYTLDTLEDVIGISSHAEGDFRNAMQERNAEALNALSKPANADGKQPSKKEEPAVKFNDKDFKKLFRKIAIKCHPDKIINETSEQQRSFLKLCYENLNKANDTYDWGLLLKVSLELDIDIPDLSEEAISNINENMDKIKNKINHYEKSMAYQWYTSSDPIFKDNYLDECANIFMKSISIKRPNEDASDT